MKTFLLDIIPRLQRFSSKLENNSVLTNKNWVLLGDEPNKKVVYIFSEKENLLRIAENGIIKKGKWDNLGNNFIEIEIDNGAMLFKHAFVDDNLLALKLDGTEEFAILVNESNYDKFLNSIDKLNSFVEDMYLKQTTKSYTSLPNQVDLKISLGQDFDPNDFPGFQIELDILKRKLKAYPKKNIADIIISFTKDHSLKNDLFMINPHLSLDIVNRIIELDQIEIMFDISKSNSIFQKNLENYIRSELG
jgi:hypothetical protein